MAKRKTKKKKISKFIRDEFGSKELTIAERMKRLRRRMLTQQRALDKYKKLIKRSLKNTKNGNKGKNNTN